MSQEPQKVPDIVTLKVGFPTDDPSQAYSIRKAILDLLADLPNSKIEFSILSMPGGVNRSLSRGPFPPTPNGDE